MGSLKPGRTMNKPKPMLWTRISKTKPRRSYVKGVPQPKIFHYEAGSIKKKDSFPLIFHLVSKGTRQLRTNCMESARLAITGYLSSKVGVENFFSKIRVYPHSILRENPIATGAGADRFSQGMRLSFGKPIGSAAVVHSGQKFITVWAAEGKEAEVKESLRRGSLKLSGQYRIEQETK